MNSPAPNPRLPAWIFIATDVALLSAAAFIAARSPQPLPLNATIAIVACVALGAIVGLVPLVARYERLKNEALDDRQRALEALARTTATSGEQIGIAAGGLHEIADLAQRSARHAEQLPHKLQEKIAEFQAQLSVAADEEKEELEKELLALRTSESERLDSVSLRIAKTATEWTKLEAATRQHLAEAGEALAKLTAKMEAATRELDARIARLEAATAVAVTPAVTPSPAPLEVVAPVETVSAVETPAQPARKPRKPRREEAEEPVTGANVAESGVTQAPAPVVEEPPPIPMAAIPEVAPVAPGTVEPFADHLMARKPAEVAPAPERRRAARKAAAEEGQGAFELDDAASAAASVAERVMSSDGATRLLVTAYIGIGNRLFLRGEGPGLSWEKGVPLQFVSIGKWRWETNDAGGPVRFKLYKNDEIECPALGEQRLEPGHQLEVTAAF